MFRFFALAAIALTSSAAQLDKEHHGLKYTTPDGKVHVLTKEAVCADD